MTPDFIAQLLNSDKLDEALSTTDLAIADNLQPPADYHFLKGKILWRLGRRSEARNEYAIAAELDPTGPAPRAIELANEIEAFFNPDIFNP